MQTGQYTELVMMELCRDLKALGLSGIAEKYPSLFGEYSLVTDAETKEARRALMENDSAMTKRLARVYSICGETGARLFDLALLCLMQPEAAALLDEQFSGCCLESCVALSGGDPDIGSLRRDYDRVKLLLISEGAAAPFFRKRFSADDRLLCFLEGDDTPDRSLQKLVSLPNTDGGLQPLYMDADRLPFIKTALGKPGTLIQFAAEKGRGRKLLLCHACGEMGLTCLVADAGRLRAMSEERRADAIKRIRREALLEGHALCYSAIEKDEDWPLEDFLRDCVAPMASLRLPICVCTGPKVELIAASDTPVERLALPETDRDGQIALWKGYSGQFGLTGIDCRSIGSKYKLSPLQIRKAAGRLAELEKLGRPADAQAVSDVCAEVLPPAEGNIKRVKVTYTIDDLVLPPEQIQVLYNICAHVEHKRRVYDDWDMKSRFSYGRNVSALFVGAPGTGKTMAVHVLSNMLHLPLYHVDLSQVVDKYVGETEKRLEEIFNVAERSNTILFFDEADGIFGKRSDVKDSKDKYANTQSSYILQRIEQYEGVVILATNFNKNIDEAFMRRIRYVMEFQKPSEELRLRLWRGAFAEKTPLEGVDFPYLARSFELTGGSIKNIALNAAFLAAQTGGPITMEHILLSLRDENQKLGKTMLKKDFAEYGILF